MHGRKVRSSRSRHHAARLRRCCCKAALRPALQQHRISSLQYSLNKLFLLADQVVNTPMQLVGQDLGAVQHISLWLARMI
uniref:Putative toxin efflux pump n=1 Tax=Corynebacterium glutamicum TaxID=1718 RepID=D2KYA6_CORGT|nr:putative toxin efflux pump [Corynebacterium glutamicum]